MKNYCALSLRYKKIFEMGSSINFIKLLLDTCTLNEFGILEIFWTFRTVFYLFYDTQVRVSNNFILAQRVLQNNLSDLLERNQKFWQYLKFLGKIGTGDFTSPFLFAFCSNILSNFRKENKIYTFCSWKAELPNIFTYIHF